MALENFFLVFSLREIPNSCNHETNANICHRTQTMIECKRFKGAQCKQMWPQCTLLLLRFSTIRTVIDSFYFYFFFFGNAFGFFCFNWLYCTFCMLVIASSFGRTLGQTPVVKIKGFAYVTKCLRIHTLWTVQWKSQRIESSYKALPPL